MLIPTRHPKTLDRAGLGGKAANLAILAAAGLPTPEGWVVPVDVFASHLARSNLEKMLARVSRDPSEEFLRDMRSRIMSRDMEKRLMAALGDLPEVAMAVRSSASVEDQASGSYSGLFETVLGIRGTGALAEAVKRVWASVFTPRVLTYHRRMNPQEAWPAMAVLIMPMLAADGAGVAFSANPADGNPFEIAISACHGLGPTVVDGSEQCDEYLINLETLNVKEIGLGAQRSGLFLRRDGGIERQPISADRVGRRVCDDQELRRLSELVRTVDNLFDARVDVEFAVTDGKVSLLQARPLINLPPFFPDNPEEADPNLHRAGSGGQMVLSPFTQACVREGVRRAFPPPPWPLEVEEFVVRHGRLFVRLPEHPEWEQSPDEPWEDRTFLVRMRSLDDPASDLRDARQWAETACAEVIPSLRARAETVLRHGRNNLASLRPQNLCKLIQEALALERECLTLYLSASGGTYEVLRRIDILVRDWLTGPDHNASQAIAQATIQGASKLTHERDSELEQVADGQMSEDDYACRWGYGYLEIEDMMDVSRWMSWRENPKPVQIAAALLRKQRDAVPLSERVRRSFEQSDASFQDALAHICGDDHDQILHRQQIFTACVKAGRMVFPLKDDRDLVLAHGQSALRAEQRRVSCRLSGEDGS